MELIWITEAYYIDGYTLKVRFNDGCWRTFDFSTLFGTHKVYEKIRDLNVFKQFTLDGWAVSWLDGNVDVAPEYIYEHGQAA